MGQLDINKSYEPVNLTPQGATGNPLSYYVQRPSRTYATPEEFMGNNWQMGPFTEAGVYEVNGAQFLQDRWKWPRANTQIVSVPERPVDKGTYEAFGGTMHNGVYNQPATTQVAHQYSGSAPTTGVYTGYYGNNGEYEGNSC